MFFMRNLTIYLCLQAEMHISDEVNYAALCILTEIEFFVMDVVAWDAHLQEFLFKGLDHGQGATHINVVSE